MATTDAALDGPPSTERSPWVGRIIVFGRCVLAGLTIAASIPPFGWWPLAFLGVFQWDRLIADQPWTRRFRRSWLIAAAWLYPMMLWIFDLTPPGYLVACGVYAAMFGAACALVPPHRPYRWLALPGAIVLGELLRWTWPFGGVPLATLAQSQAAAPIGQTARIGNAILVSGLVAIGGVALSAAWDRRFVVAAVGLAIVVGLYGLSLVAPRGTDTGPLRIAVVQGGGLQRTPPGINDSEGVFERQLQASQLIQPPVDLVVWPENVVELDGRLDGSPEDQQLRELAQHLHATVLVGVTEVVDADNFLNAVVVYLPDGTRGDRFDKVHRVPFGEYVPFRPLIEAIAGDSGIPSRDAVPGTGPAIVHTPVGTMGLMVSWEVFFSDRAADAVDHGGEVLLNPTNGSSYWLTQVQTQQIASSRLRAIETGQWESQAAPTGFSTIMTPDGTIIDCDKITPQGTTHGECRSDIADEHVISAQMVLQATVMKRTGTTIAVAVGQWPVFALAVLAVALAWLLGRRTGPEARKRTPKAEEPVSDRATEPR
jgi:apolipoprotein N-acyltransferase